MRVMFDDPNAELSSNFRFTDPFEYCDACLPQNGDALTVDTRVRVPHPNHDPRDTARGDRT